MNYYSLGYTLCLALNRQGKNVQLEPEQTDYKCVTVERLTMHVFEH